MVPWRSTSPRSPPSAEAMSIGSSMTNGISKRQSPAKPEGNNNITMEDVELGTGSSHHDAHGGTTSHRHGHQIKAKSSDIIELTPPSSSLVVGTNGDGTGSKAPGTPRGSRHTEGDHHSTWKSLVASVMYSGCSVGMVLVNKSLASR